MSGKRIIEGLKAAVAYAKGDASKGVLLTGEESPEFKRMVEWFNHWMEIPLSAREKTIIAEAINYTKKREDVPKRYA